MTLNDNIHVLTREHLTQDKNGHLRAIPALLAELRLAVTPGNSKSGGGSDGPPSPINLGAVDMLEEIEKEARKDYTEATGVVWRGDLMDLLKSYPDAPITAEWEAYLAKVTLGWVDQITAFLWPVKPRRKLVGKVCPSCGWATYGEDRKTCLSLGCWDDDGSVLPPGKWDIECGSCEAGWSGDQIAWLISVTDTPDETVVAEVAEVMYR